MMVSAKDVEEIISLLNEESQKARDLGYFCNAKLQEKVYKGVQKLNLESLSIKSIEEHINEQVLQVKIRDKHWQNKFELTPIQNNFAGKINNAIYKIKDKLGEVSPSQSDFLLSHIRFVFNEKVESKEYRRIAESFFQLKLILSDLTTVNALYDFFLSGSEDAKFIFYDIPLFVSPVILTSLLTKEELEKLNLFQWFSFYSANGVPRDKVVITCDLLNAVYFLHKIKENQKLVKSVENFGIKKEYKVSASYMSENIVNLTKVIYPKCATKSLLSCLDTFLNHVSLVFEQVITRYSAPAIILLNNQEEDNAYVLPYLMVIFQEYLPYVSDAFIKQAFTYYWKQIVVIGLNENFQALKDKKEVAPLTFQFFLKAIEKEWLSNEANLTTKNFIMLVNKYPTFLYLKFFPKEGLFLNLHPVNYYQNNKDFINDDKMYNLVEKRKRVSRANNYFEINFINMAKNKKEKGDLSLLLTPSLLQSFAYYDGVKTLSYSEMQNYIFCAKEIIFRLFEHKDEYIKNHAKKWIVEIENKNYEEAQKSFIKLMVFLNKSYFNFTKKHLSEHLIVSRKGDISRGISKNKKNNKQHISNIQLPNGELEELIIETCSLETMSFLFLFYEAFEEDDLSKVKFKKTLEKQSFFNEIRKENTKTCWQDIVTFVEEYILKT